MHLTISLRHANLSLRTRHVPHLCSRRFFFTSGKAHSAAVTFSGSSSVHVLECEWQLSVWQSTQVVFREAHEPAILSFSRPLAIFFKRRGLALVRQNDLNVHLRIAGKEARTEKLTQSRHVYSVSSVRVGRKVWSAGTGLTPTLRLC